MLPSKQRLTRQQFNETLKNPEIKVVFNAVGTLKYIKTGKTGFFGVVTGSKQQKKAVLRNKLRRRIYALLSKNPYNTDMSGVFYASKQAYDMSYAQIKDLFYALLSKSTK